MNNLTAPQRDTIKAGIVLAVMLFAATGAYYWYFVKDEIVANQKKVTTTDTEIKNLQARLEEMERAKENMALVREKQRLLEEVASKLPTTNAPQDFYEALDNILRVTQVSYSEMLLLPVQERAIYSEIPWRIIGRGRYHDFGQFLNLVEENPNRLMRIKTFKIENDDNRPSIHPLTVELATFKFNKRG